ncbi:MAG: metallophosphoesterase [Pseudomonadota bacterium]
MHRNLGRLDGPVLLFGGPVSNLQATSSLLAQADAWSIPAEHRICTGDVTAYCGAPAQTVDLIRERDVIVVAGNCEKQLASEAEGCGCGFEDGSTCDRLSAAWYAYANKAVGPDARRWMSTCPDIVSFYHQGARYAMIHGGLTDVARFVWPVSGPEVFAEEWHAIEVAIGPVDHVIAGHCGLPFQKTTAQGNWINPGVIGLPPNDGGQQTRFAVLDGGEVLFHRLTYDVDSAYASMVNAGLTQGYHTALRSGYWPSEDVLPETLRAPSLARG